MSTDKIELITSNNILTRLYELDIYCSSIYGDCAILLQDPDHRWPAITEAQDKADPTLNKKRMEVSSNIRKLWGFLVGHLHPTLDATLRNKGVIKSKNNGDMIEALSKLVLALREIASGTSSNVTMQNATLHKLMTMKCDLTQTLKCS